MALTQREVAALDEIRGRLALLRHELTTSPLPSEDNNPEAWLTYLKRLKAINGNTDLSLSLVACLLAKEYLCRHLPMRDYDAAVKAQGARGLDIDERTVDGDRVVGEIKTTMPYAREKGLGANQRASFVKDFRKLADADAAHKFFFVTERLTFELVCSQYGQLLQGVTVVLLGADETRTP